MQIFTTQKEDISGRLDCYYYQPEFVELEKRIKKKTNKILGDFVLGIAGGATPNKLYSDKYYAKSADGGIPFLRVQNVTNEGLNFKNCKFIKPETHQGMLKRSQIKEDYLITKITGVGRMAVSTVAPQNFEGNINQHLVAIKTKSREISEILATFLNSDIGERLASRRSTGGTRPALDYKALLGIPVILNPKIVSVMQSAYKTREEKLKQADKLLNSIDGYVRQQLDIDYTEPEEEKIYTVNLQDLEGSRQDPHYHNPKFATVIKQLKAGKYPIEILGKYITEIRYGASLKNDYVDDGIPLLRIVNLKPNNIDLTDVVQLPKSKAKVMGNCYVYKGDLLISRSGTIGIVAVVPKEADGFAYGSFMIKFKLNDELDSNYASVWLNSDISKLLVQRERIGAIQGNITIPTIQGFLLPIPPLDRQKEIASGVTEKYRKVADLKNEASKLLEDAKKKVEEMILN